MSRSHCHVFCHAPHALQYTTNKHLSINRRFVFIGKISTVKGQKIKSGYKQLSDEVCDIQNNQGRGKRLRLSGNLTETLIILDITKTESNNCFIVHWRKKILMCVFAFSLTASNTKRANLTWLPLEIMHRSLKLPSFRQQQQKERGFTVPDHFRFLYFGPRPFSAWVTRCL